MTHVFPQPNHCACESSPPTLISRIRYRVLSFKYSVKHFLYMAGWRFLWITHLGWPYSRFMCRHGWYRTFMDGRCMFCGNKHHGKSHDAALENVEVGK